jgi:hypothetical protein
MGVIAVARRDRLIVLLQHRNELSSEFVAIVEHVRDVSYHAVGEQIRSGGLSSNRRDEA